jgi:hypothetical protein
MQLGSSESRQPTTNKWASRVTQLRWHSGGMRLSPGQEVTLYVQRRVFVGEPFNGNWQWENVPGAAGKLTLHPDTRLVGVHVGMTNFGRLNLDEDPDVAPDCRSSRLFSGDQLALNSCVNNWRRAARVAPNRLAVFIPYDFSGTLGAKAQAFEYGLIMSQTSLSRVGLVRAANVLAHELGHTVGYGSDVTRQPTVATPSAYPLAHALPSQRISASWTTLRLRSRITAPHRSMSTTPHRG